MQQSTKKWEEAISKGTSRAFLDVQLNKHFTMHEALSYGMDENRHRIADTRR